MSARASYVGDGLIRMTIETDAARYLLELLTEQNEREGGRDSGNAELRAVLTEALAERLA